MTTNSQPAAAERIDDIDASAADPDIRNDPEPPVAPQWTPGKPDWLTTPLMKMAGVDLPLAAEMPADEQQQMKRVGIALAFGLMFQALCVSSALTVAFGDQGWILLVTFVVCGVLYAFDAKFVATDWEAQGASLCRSRGIIPKGDLLERSRRPIAIFVRWGMSGFIASTLAVFVLLKVFTPDIANHWAQVNRAQNAPIASLIGIRHDALVADLVQRIAQSDDRLARLNRERTESPSVPSLTTDIDRQIVDRLDHIKVMEAAKAEAQRSSADHRADTLAEKGGIRAREGNTGAKGKGDYYDFHVAMADEQDQAARARAADIEDDQKTIVDLRRQRATIIDGSSFGNRTEAEAIERRIADETGIRSTLSAERKQLEDNREAWIDTHMRDAPGYVPPPQGIVAQLRGLWIVVSDNPLIAGLAFSSKILVMLLESAGAVAKVFFTRPGMYAMLIALRIHDSFEMEADRRVKWEHWRLLNRNHSDEAMDVIRASRRRRDTANHARNAVHKVVERFSWMQ